MFDVGRNFFLYYACNHRDVEGEVSGMYIPGLSPSPTCCAECASARLPGPGSVGRPNTVGLPRPWRVDWPGGAGSAAGAPGDGDSPLRLVHGSFHVKSPKKVPDPLRF